MKSSLLPITLTLIGVACVSPSGNRAPSSTDSPKNPETLDGSLLNFDLMPEESWQGGSRESELAAFMTTSQQIMQVAKSVEAEYPAKPGFDLNNRSGRIAHDKSHGCLTGTLRILSDRPGDKDGVTYKGLFAAKDKVYQLIGRFTNGTGVREHDAKPSLRGMSVKIFTDDGKTVDLTAANSDTAVGRDFQNSFEVIAASLAGAKAGVDYSIKAHQEQLSHPEELDFRYVFFRTLSNVASVAHEKYWSGHPYALGSSHYMKFMFQPQDWTDENQMSYEHQGGFSSDADFAWKATKQLLKNFTTSPNYLREDLARQSQNGPIKFTVMMQLFKDAKSTPIEDSLVVWNEKVSQPIPVAEIVFEPQKFNVADRDIACDAMRFTPGHYDPVLRPVGNTGRGRIFGYLANALARASKAAEPDAAIVDRWRAGDYR